MYENSLILAKKIEAIADDIDNNNRCELCNERQSTLTIEDNEGLTLRLCKNCFESEYGGEDIEWMH